MEQITAAYYFTLVEQINNGTCSKQVIRKTNWNGCHAYVTYYLRR